MKKTWTKNEARNVLVRYHMINTSDLLEGERGILDVIKRLQSIQYDPLNVVGINTCLVMQSRVNDYKKDDLKKLLYEKRALIDGFDKMMSIYLTKDFPLLEEVRKYTAEMHYNTLVYRNQTEALDYIDEVKNSLKEKPKYASEIELGGRLKSGWGQTKTSSATLDYLFFRGDIGVRNKKNTLKQYDLIENLIENSDQKSPFKTRAEFIKYYLLRRIKSLGICRDKNGVHLSGPYISDKHIRSEYLIQLVSDGLIEEIEIEGLSDRFYVPKEATQLTNQIVDKIAFIAPLDNLIWDRDFIEMLFDFKYRWEVYTPKNKRLYGYYVLPVLYKDQFIGRIEFAKHRLNDELKILNYVQKTQSISIEDDVFIEAIKRFKHYLKQ